MPRRLFDTLQFIQIAKISRQTLIKWQKMDLIPKRKIGNGYYFLQEDIDAVPKIKKHMRSRMLNGYKMRKDLG